MNILNLKTVKKVLSFFSLLAIITSVSAQVSDVAYTMKFNEETCLFDCYMIVKEGGAQSMRERVQFNAHYTVVVPTGSEVVVEEVYMPLKNNQGYRSSEPTDWYVSTMLRNPSSRSGSDFYGIAPALTPSAFYNDVRQGDEIKLFSISVTPMVECGQGVRLYNPLTDPTSSDPGMEGSDFNHGFTMGGLNQLYSGNEEISYPASPELSITSIAGAKNQVLGVDAIVKSSCQQGLSYTWMNEAGLIVSNAKSIEVSKSISQKYTVEVVDKMGCKSSKTILVSEGNTNVLSDVNGLDNEEDEDNIYEGLYNSSIYPNPAKESFNFTFVGNVGDNLRANIVDQNGKIVEANVINTVLTSRTLEERIPVTFASGLYSLTLEVNKTPLKSKKLIIIE